MLRNRFCTCYYLRVSVMAIRLASNGRSPHGYVQTTPVSRPPPTTLVASPRWPVKKCSAQALKHSVCQCLFSCLWSFSIIYRTRAYGRIGTIPDHLSCAGQGASEHDF